MSKPGQLLNHEEVEFLLEAAQSASSEQNTAQAGAQQAATMRGDLRQIQLADIFQTIGMSKMEGMLHVRNAIEQRHVHFKDGFVRILVPPRAATRRLGQRLVQAGILDPDDFREVLVAQGKERKPMGQLLVEGGYVTVEQIDEIIAQQITEELFGLFTWQHGDFEFFRGPQTDEKLAEQLELCPEFEINSLLLEVARRSDEWESILDSLGNLDEVPMRIVEGMPESKELTSVHKAVLDAIDGRSTYRELGEHTMMPVFDCARAARDLFRHGCIATIDDASMLEVARWHYKQDHPKQAMMVLYTLRDRPGERSLDTVREIAHLLCASNETKAACAVLLEAAQLQTQPRAAIDLALEARGYNPRDLTVLNFLRTTMLAHLSPDAPEIEATTLELLDGLLADGDADRALGVVEEMRQLERYTAAIMMREARAYAKKKENAAAIEVLTLAAREFEAVGDVRSETEAYELAARLDRSRRDIAKILRQKRMTPAKRLVRVLGYTSALSLIGFAGLTWHESNQLQKNLSQARQEITDLLEQGERRQASARIVHWRTEVGDNPLFDDLAAQVRFADATEANHRKQQLRQVATEQLQLAADLLRDGDVDGALELFDRVAAAKEHLDLAVGSAKTRADGLQRELDAVARQLPNQLPGEPTPLLDRAAVAGRLEHLRKNGSPRLLRAAHQIIDRHKNQTASASLPKESFAALVAAAERAIEPLQRAAALELTYEKALAQLDTQQQLDPIWKRALALENELRFAEALEQYRTIHGAEAGRTQLRAHFVAKIRQLEDIVQTTADIDSASRTGDYPTARRALDGLRRRYPDIPFARCVRLPVHVTTSMPGAKLRWNGVEIATTPCIATYLPSLENQLEVVMPGFQVEHLTLPEDHDGSVEFLLTLQPLLEVQLPAVVDQPLGVDARGIAYGADRQGDLFAIDLETGGEVWRWHSGDTAGYLSGPIRFGPNLLVGSLDGPLRCLAAADGKPIWSVPGLPTEIAPRLVDDTVVLACTNGRLCLVEAASGTILRERMLPEPPRGEMVATREGIVVPLADGSLTAWSLRLDPLWRSGPGEHGLWLAGTTAGFAAVRDDGFLELLRVDSGARVWQRQLAGSPIGPPLFAAGALQVSLDDRALRIDLATGKDAWVTPRPEDGWNGAARMVAGRLAAPSRDGWIYVYPPDARAPAYRIAGERRSVVFAESPGGNVAVLRGKTLALFRRWP